MISIIRDEIIDFEKRVGYINDHYPNGLDELKKSLSRIHHATKAGILSRLHNERSGGPAVFEWDKVRNAEERGFNLCLSEIRKILND